MYTLQFSLQSNQDLKKISKNIQKRIINKLEFYSLQSDPIVFAKRMTKSEIGKYRFRIGDYRVIFDIEENNILFIIRIGHRKNIYRC